MATIYDYYEDPARHSCCEKLIKHLELWASRTNTDIEKWELESFLSCTDHNGNITSESRLNKLFSCRKANEASVAAPWCEKAQVALNTKLHQVKENWYFASKEHKEATIINQHSNINYYLDQIRTAQRSICEIEALEIEDVDVAGNFKTALSNTPFFAPIEFEAGLLHLKTMSDAVLTEVNDLAMVNIQVNLGRFLIKLDPLTLSTTVHKYSRNLVTEGGHYHPHVSNSGKFCWGNGSHIPGNCVKSGQYQEYFTTLAYILTNYGGSPYVALARFKAIQDSNIKARVESQERQRQFNDEQRQWVQQQQLVGQHGMYRIQYFDSDGRMPEEI